jgi:uncharacterized protein
MDYVLRFYRDWMKQDDLTAFEVKLRETDLAVRARSDLSPETRRLVRRFRSDVEIYADTHPGFVESLAPWPDDESAPPLVREMLRNTALYGVGPMAAVAGAVSDAVGRELLKLSPEVIVENGGDIFLQMNRTVKLMLYSGEESPFGGKLILRIDAPGEPRGVCTSSAKIGPSLNFGNIDAVMIIADSAALADAAATAVGNRVKEPGDVNRVLEDEKSRGLLRGAVITIGDTLGAFGDVVLEEVR